MKCFFLMCFMVVFFSCSKDLDSNKSKTSNEQISSDIIKKLNDAGFVTSEGFRRFKDGYIVEDCYYLTKGQIDSLGKSNSKSNLKHYSTTSNPVVGTRTIRIFMDPTFGTFMQNAFDLALDRYNSLSLRLRFERANVDNGEMSIIAFYEESTTLGLSAGFPVGGEPARTIYLNTYYYNNTSARADATTTIAHEIGHAIGFRHTDYMNRAFSCGGQAVNEGDAGVGVNYIPGTPTGPENGSWMLACSNNTDRPFTSNDRIALLTMYPTNRVTVYRTWQPTDKDWVSLREDQNSDAWLQQRNYLYKTFQFYAFATQQPNTVAVYRAWQPADKDWVSLTTDDPEFPLLEQHGYLYKTFQFYAYKTQQPNTVAVYRAWQPVDKDWVLLREDQNSDSWLQQHGYLYKTFEFYAPIQ